MPESRRRLSREIIRHSHSLDLEREVFTQDDPGAIAASLKRSAERSLRRRTDPFRSAMSMLNFYINRAGRDLDERQRKVLEDTRDALRAAFDRPPKAESSGEDRHRGME